MPNGGFHEGLEERGKGFRVQWVGALASSFRSNSKLKSLNIDSLPPIIINNVALPYVSQTKCLGLSLNNDLLWKNYVSQTVRKILMYTYT
ncbi:Protein of unknown function [Cotesia congregata]|uniref:Uncharacterized protein n=1 Tax=Cotesia congregata TaxID=51543 RepID=A0A8J2MPN4_COTCN|nr:Protein of unknown function [Cotesia congregata]